MLKDARAGVPEAQAALKASVAQAMRDQGIELTGKPASAAQQQALRTSGEALREFDLPTGGPVPVPPPGGAANDNAAPDGVRDALAPEMKPAATAPAAPFQRTPKQAAEALRDFLSQTHRFGHGGDRPQEVRDAQRDMGITPDGIVGPITRKTAATWNVTLPADANALPAAASKSAANKRKLMAAKKPAKKKTTTAHA